MPRKDIMRFMDCFLVVALMFCIGEGIGQEHAAEGLLIWFTKEFIWLMRSIRFTDVGSKIFRKVFAYIEFSFFGYGFEKCPQRLHHIISEKMNCRGVAVKLEPQLLSVQIYYSMTEDEQLWESIMMSRNCTQLSGVSFALCEKVFSGRMTNVRNSVDANLNEEINNCYIEEKGNLGKYMSKR